MDHVIQSNCPTVMAPRFTDFVPLQTAGERFIVAKDKLLFEVSRPWVRAVRAVTAAFDKTTPYGVGPEEGIELRCGPVPKAHLATFVQQAREESPNETAAWVVWNEDTKEFTYLPLVIISAKPCNVHFERPHLPRGTHLVMDIHSHGSMPAFFSETDDADDANQLCISAVVGHVNQDQPSFCARLSMLGVYIPLEFKWNTK